jgi:hypothetical protein
VIFNLIEASGVMQVPLIWGIAAFAGGIVFLGGVFVYFTRER